MHKERKIHFQIILERNRGEYILTIKHKCTSKEITTKVALTIDREMARSIWGKDNQRVFVRVLKKP